MPVDYPEDFYVDQTELYFNPGTQTLLPYYIRQWPLLPKLWGQGMTVHDSYTTVSVLILHQQICRPLQALDISSAFSTDFLLIVTD